MKKSLISGVVAMLLSSNFGYSQIQLNDKQDSVSYAIGVLYGSQIVESLPEDVKLEALEGGLIDGIKKQPLMTDEQADNIVREHMVALQAKVEAENAAKCEKNTAEGEEFLAKNAKKKGVVVTESGLQYKVLKEGKGNKPAEYDVVTVNYKGMFIDGTVFDQSEEPINFPCNAVIQGFSEILRLMNEGTEVEVYIPSELAYGEMGAGPIEPCTTLIFDITLLDVLENDSAVEPIIEEYEIEEQATDGEEF